MRPGSSELTLSASFAETYAAAHVQYAWGMLHICCRDTAGPAHLEAHADDGSSKSRRGVEEEDLQALSAHSPPQSMRKSASR